MKKKWIFFLLLGLTNMNVLLFGQRDDKRKAEFEEFKEKRVAFITQATDLDAEEAKVFWPLYNELQEKKFELNKQLRKTLFEFSENKKNHTESDYKEIVDLYTQSRIKEAQLDEEYIAKFAKVISYEKIYLYQQAELQFARQMLDQRRERDFPKPK
ncbi:MAG: hypothetical protein FWF53_09820 [Candidatus Azobacteroides sp.]|nr:hypothetical protein [Candidatus Azobacteroides sp.]